MKIAIKVVVLAVVLGSSFCVGYAKGTSSRWLSITNSAVRDQLRSFVAAKEAQADSAAGADGRGMPPEYKTFFAAATKGDWLTVSNLFWKLGGENGGLDEIYTNKVDTTFRGVRWEALREIWGAYAAFADGNEKYSELYANEIIPSIPPGSIYFGGSDPGRFIITALEKSQIKAEPFFTLTQNALADGTYLDYLRSMYGKEIYIPTPEDSERSFNDYYLDVKTRFKNHQLKQGEDVTEGSNGELQVNGRIAVIEINARMAKVIFDKETKRDFYVEESAPLDWMYPYLEPHGLIFKLNRKPLEKLSDSIVARDDDYWSKLVSPMIGDWLNDETALSEVAAFVQKVFLRRDLSNFQGDPIFDKNIYAHSMFAKDRVAIAGFYAWRADHSSDEAEKKRMQHEADFAFRQAWAMCPDSPEVVIRYVDFLMETPRIDDAILVAKTCLPMDIRDDDIISLLASLEQYKKQSGERAEYLRQVQTMEDEAKVNPTDYTNLFALAWYYVQMNETNRANEAVEDAISITNVYPGVFRTAAKYFAWTGQFQKQSNVLAECSRRILALEDEARTNSTDYQNLFFVAYYYLQGTETNRADQFVATAISAKHVSPDLLRAAAEFYGEAGQSNKLESVLKKLATVEPGLPAPKR